MTALTALLGYRAITFYSGLVKSAEHGRTIAQAEMNVSGLERMLEGQQVIDPDEVTRQEAYACPT